MIRNTTVGVLVLLMLACGIPAYGANKETIQLEEQVKLLGDQMTLGEVAAAAATNEYEILTRLRRVPRKYEG